MKRRPRRSSRSSIGFAPVELELPPARWLALLLAVHALALPIYLAAAPIRHGLPAALGCLGFALGAAPAFATACLGRGPRAPRRLCFTPEGGFRLDLAGGYSEAVVPADRSLIAGPWWVLVLEGVRQRHYVVLETRRADPAGVAALARALRRLAARPGQGGAALRSLIEPGRPDV